MTQAELELIVRETRARGLHSTWNELLAFSEGVVGGLVDAYQALLKSTAKSDKVSSSDFDDVQKVVKDKLAAVLTLLTSRAQVAKWEAELLDRSDVSEVHEIRYSDPGDSFAKGSGLGD